jgi:hypothetical protein
MSQGAVKTMKRIQASIVSLLASAMLSAGIPAAAEAADPERWGDYLDFAYVYSSADAPALKERLAEYGAEAGIPLDRYIAEFLGDPDASADAIDEVELRRKAIGYLLLYLSTRDPFLVDQAAVAPRNSRLAMSYMAATDPADGEVIFTTVMGVNTSL